MPSWMWWGEGHYYPLFSIQRPVRQVRGFGGPRHLNPVLAPTPPFLLWWTIVDINKPRHSVLNEGKGSQNHSFCQSESAAPGNIIQFNQSGRSQVSSGNDCTCSGGCDSSLCWSWGCSSFFGTRSFTWNFLQLIPMKFMRSILSQHLQFWWLAHSLDSMLLKKSQNLCPFWTQQHPSCLGYLHFSCRKSG